MISLQIIILLFLVTAPFSLPQKHNKIQPNHSVPKNKKQYF